MPRFGSDPDAPADAAHCPRQVQVLCKARNPLKRANRSQADVPNRMDSTVLRNHKQRYGRRPHR